MTSPSLVTISTMLKKWAQELGMERMTLETHDDPMRVYTHGVTVHFGLMEDESSLNDIRTWVESTYGHKQYGEYYSDRWYLSNHTFWFKYERDRTIFLLRWTA